MSDENDNLDDAISSLQDAFSDGASLEAMKKGEPVLDAMLAALRGAMGAEKAPAASAECAADAAEPAAKATKPAKTPDMLDFVVGFLKSKLDDEDRAAVESEAPPFSVPFINM